MLMTTTTRPIHKSYGSPTRLASPIIRPASEISDVTHPDEGDRTMWASSRLNTSVKKAARHRAMTGPGTRPVSPRIWNQSLSTPKHTKESGSAVNSAPKLDTANESGTVADGDDAELSRLRLEVAQLRETVNYSSDQWSQAKSELDSLQSEHEEAVEKLNNHIGWLADRLKDEELQKKQLDDQKQRLKSEVDQLKEYLNTLPPQSEVERLRHKLKDCTEREQSVRSDLKKVQEALEEERARSRMIDSKWAQLQCEHEEALSQVSKLQTLAENDALRRKKAAGLDVRDVESILYERDLVVDKSKRLKQYLVHSEKRHRRQIQKLMADLAAKDDLIKSHSLKLEEYQTSLAESEMQVSGFKDQAEKLSEQLEASERRLIEASVQLDSFRRDQQLNRDVMSAEELLLHRMASCLADLEVLVNVETQLYMDQIPEASVMLGKCQPRPAPLAQIDQDSADSQERMALLNDHLQRTHSLQQSLTSLRKKQWDRYADILADNLLGEVQDFQL